MVSNAGRNVLLKAVGEAVPIYTLSCFRLPDTLINKIHRILTQYWWGQKRTERRMVWIGWDTMSRPKKEGGLGLKDLRAQNLALLGKQYWRIATQPNSILARTLKGKYFKYSNAMSAELGGLPSWGWRSILEGRTVVEKGLNWRVGSGSSIRVFSDPWLPPPYPFRIPLSQPITPKNPVFWVKDLMLPDRNWNHNLIANSFSPEIQSRIYSIQLVDGEDVLQ
ncbi:uncharacterized mitochondrial protein AtMg00310-like [Arachis hypogaea]|uniref:uncharacterized mitochondrial protein AtMg00310-like n=1 Tax=Arachis hypogaea TaxID=3818 RepID=UPI003B21CAF7